MPDKIKFLNKHMYVYESVFSILYVFNSQTKPFNSYIDCRERMLKQKRVLFRILHSSSIHCQKFDIDLVNRII